MEENVDAVCTDLKDLFKKLLKEKRRFYGEDWSDWKNKTTGGQKHPCVYLLWQKNEVNRPSYIGETVGLGRRLYKHWDEENWSKPKWQSVQYISDSKLDDGEFRQLFECFCIYIMNPKDNDINRKK